MSFSQELKDFTAAANAGYQLGNKSAENAEKEKHNRALEDAVAARVPNKTPVEVPSAMAEGRAKWGPGGTGVPMVGAPSGEPGGAAGNGEWWTPERMRYAANYLETKAGLSPYGASGIVARWAGIESRDKGPESVNPDSGAFGTGQWLGARLTPIKGNTNFDAQLQHAALELTPGTREAQTAGTADAIKLLRSANSKEDAARGASMFERAEGYDPKTGLDNFTWKTPVERVYNTIYGRRSAVPAAAHGGMIHRYESGGAVSADVPRLEDGREDMTNRYNTQLSPQDEDRYMAWLRANNRDNDTRDYDMRGAWVENAKQSDNGHFPDTYKKPNHPTFSTHSKYHGVDGNIGGEWGGEDGAWTYTPSETNLKNMSPAQLQEYFRRVEPNSKLLLPPSSAPHYADGGAVDQQKPYYAEDLMNDVNGALGKLGDAVRGGFEWITNHFGLNKAPAVAQADPDYMKRVDAFVRDPGADPQQVQEVKRTVDPDNQLGDALATTYGLIKSREFHLKNGDTEAANKAAGALLLYTRDKSRQLGALALHAIQEGDQSTAAKALAQAYNFLPNGNKMEINGDKATLIDQKTGKIIREVEFTPGTLVNAATGMVSGDAWLNDLAPTLKTDKEKVAEIKADAQLGTAVIKTEGQKDVANTKAGAAVDVQDKKNTGALNVQDRKNAGALAVQGEKNTGALDVQDKKNTGALDVANVTQGGANYRAGVAADTSTANNRNTNETNERIAGVKVEGQKDVANTRAGAAVDVANITQAGQNQRNTATNETRKDIAAGQNATKVQTTMDILDAKKSEADDRNATNLNIANQKIVSAEKQTTEKLAGADTRQQRALGVRQTEGAANRANQAAIASGHDETAAANTNARLTGADTRQQRALAVKQTEGAANRSVSRANTQDRIGANAANKAIDVDAKKAAADAANQENDRRVDRKAALTRQGSQLTLIDKMTDHVLLGADELLVPKVSASQAQATRNIARGIVESAGDKIAGDEAASYARQLTKWDKAAGRPAIRVKLNSGNRSVTMPDGVTLPLSESAFKEVARIHGGAQ